MALELTEAYPPSLSGHLHSAEPEQHICNLHTAVPTDVHASSVIRLLKVVVKVSLCQTQASYGQQRYRGTVQETGVLDLARANSLWLPRVMFKFLSI